MQNRHTGTKAINELLDRAASPGGYQHKLRTSILVFGAGGHVLPRTGSAGRGDRRGPLADPLTLWGMVRDGNGLTSRCLMTKLDSG